MTQHDILIDIQADCKKLAYQADSMPFTGKSAGRLFGELFAMVATLAAIIDKQNPQGRLEFYHEPRT